MNNTIEKLIRSVNKDVVSVNFDVKKQAVIDDKINGMSYYDKTIITVVVMLIPVLILAYSILDKFMF